MTTLSRHAVSIAFLAGLAACVLAMGGCGGLTPTEKTDTSSAILHETAAARTTADVTRDTEATPSSTVVKIGDGNSGSITLPPPSSAPSRVHAVTTADEHAGVSQTLTSDNSISIPLYVKVIGLVIGGFLIVGLIALCIYLWRKLAASSPVIAGLQATGSQLGLALDNGLHQAVAHLQTAVNMATTPEAKTQALASLAAVSTIAASTQAAAPTAPAPPVTATVPASK